MKPKLIHPNNALACEISQHITPHAETGSMLAKSVDDIMAKAQSWFALIGETQELQGFFELRDTHHPEFAEMGSVLSVSPQSGVGLVLLQEFQTIAAVQGNLSGCAITQGEGTAYGFFEAHTKRGQVTSFPSWWCEKRDQNDRFFVQWQL